MVVLVPITNTVPKPLIILVNLVIILLAISIMLAIILVTTVILAVLVELVVLVVLALKYHQRHYLHHSLTPLPFFFLF